MHRQRLVLLCLAHFLVDTLASFMNPLMPTFQDRLAMSNLGIGIVATCGSLTTSFTQPAWGYLSDRMRAGGMVIYGPIVALVMIGLVGLAPSMAWLSLLVIMSGFGVAAFHPEGAAEASRASGQRQALGIALFVISGHMGLGCGPLLAGYLADGLGLDRSWWIIPPGLVILGLLGLRLHGTRATVARRASAGLRTLWCQHQAILVPLLGLSILRAFVGIALSFGMPFWWQSQGLPESRIGLLSGAFLFAGGVAGFVAGLLVRPGQERRWIVGTLLAALPALWLLLRQQSPMGLLLGAIVGGALLNATIPMVIVYAQRLMRGGESVAASLMLGVAWGIGGALAPPIIRVAQGRLGEAVTLQWALLGLLPAIWLATRLPAAPRSTPAAP